MTLPKRKRRPRMMVRLPSTIVSPGHCSHVRKVYACVCEGLTDIHGVKHVCVGRMEAHHMTTRGAGGGDETIVPMCSLAHSTWHLKGRETFAKMYGQKEDWLDLKAAELWQADAYHRLKLERAHMSKQEN